MDTKMREFVAVGMERYPEAQQTISFFQETVLNILDSAIRDAERPSAFMRGESQKPARNVSRTWISSFIAGRVADKYDARVEVGIWWNPGALDELDMPIVYANLVDAPEAIQRFEPTTLTDQLRRYPSGGRRATRLYVIASKPPNLEADAHLVLNALQEEIARTAEAVEVPRT